MIFTVVSCSACTVVTLDALIGLVEVEIIFSLNKSSKSTCETSRVLGTRRLGLISLMLRRLPAVWPKLESRFLLASFNDTYFIGFSETFLVSKVDSLSTFEISSECLTTVASSTSNYGYSNLSDMTIEGSYFTRLAIREVSGVV